MKALSLTAIILASSAGFASAEGFWKVPGGLDASVQAAAALYAAEPNFNPHKPVSLSGRAPELAALYDGMDERLAPMRIYTFSEKPEEAHDITKIPTTFLPGSPEDMIVSLIRRFEAGRAGYDSVWNGNKHPLPKKPTEMTVCEVRDWQLAARRIQKSTAIGMYQIVGGTYRRVTEQMNLPCDTLFDAKTQDRIGLALLYGRGWAEFKAGTMKLEDFAYELAGEWAAFPAPYGEHKGFSRHRGIAGNRHLIELPEYLAYLSEIRDLIKSGDAVSSEEQLDLVDPEADNLEQIPLASMSGDMPPAPSEAGSMPAAYEVVDLSQGTTSQIVGPDEMKTAALKDGRERQILHFSQ
ncbi:lysozyme family protein [Falsigemmobacter faecalis]|uniref:Transglycosylase SLT domain-containing protein n=1 Tax=Falsigemmobacter faecalis TaxID=2488730 RepID=A0A3P3DJL6_9RHOB|nr:hypothetical protein [Falsigemmobacter faecalis]RRH74459.1 hypothetical protein EG244_10265 [Falsigemmobacter faecalis]